MSSSGVSSKAALFEKAAHDNNPNATVRNPVIHKRGAIPAFANHTSNQLNIVMFGGPGAGKGAHTALRVDVDVGVGVGVGVGVVVGGWHNLNGIGSTLHVRPGWRLAIRSGAIRYNSMACCLHVRF